MLKTRLSESGSAILPYIQTPKTVNCSSLNSLSSRGQLSVPVPPSSNAHIPLIVDDKNPNDESKKGTSITDSDSSIGDLSRSSSSSSWKTDNSDSQASSATDPTICPDDHHQTHNRMLSDCSTISRETTYYDAMPDLSQEKDNQSARLTSSNRLDKSLDVTIDSQNFATKHTTCLGETKGSPQKPSKKLEMKDVLNENIQVSNSIPISNVQINPTSISDEKIIHNNVEPQHVNLSNKSPKSKLRKSFLGSKITSLAIGNRSRRSHARSISIDNTTNESGFKLQRNDSTFTLSGRLQGIATEIVPPLPSVRPSFEHEIRDESSLQREKKSTFGWIRRGLSVSDKSQSKNRRKSIINLFSEPSRENTIPMTSALPKGIELSPTRNHLEVSQLDSNSEPNLSSSTLDSHTPSQPLSSFPFESLRSNPTLPSETKFLHLKVLDPTPNSTVNNVSSSSVTPSPKYLDVTPGANFYRFPASSVSESAFDHMGINTPRFSREQKGRSIKIPRPRKESLLAGIASDRTGTGLSPADEMIAMSKRPHIFNGAFDYNQCRHMPSPSLDLFTLTMQTSKLTDPIARAHQLRKFITRELILTERSYLHQLIILHDQYYLTLIHSPTFKNKNLLPIQSLSNIFEHVPSLVYVSKDLTDALAQCWTHARPSEVAGVFLNRIDALEKSFVNYARSYGSALETVKRVRRNRRRGWEKWMKEAREQVMDSEEMVHAGRKASLPHIKKSILINNGSANGISSDGSKPFSLSHLLSNSISASAIAALRRLTLEDLLVTPVQRVMRYILLLKDLKNNTVSIDGDNINDFTAVTSRDIQDIHFALVSLQHIAAKCDKAQSGVDKIETTFIGTPKSNSSTQNEVQVQILTGIAM